MKRLLLLSIMFLSLSAIADGKDSEIILGKARKVARVTGASMKFDGTIPNPNNTDQRWNLGGTDLGIIWEVSPGKYALAFGDSYGDNFKPSGHGGPGKAGDWRSNVLAFTENTDLENGLIFSSMMTTPGNDARAEAMIIREDNREFTYIPTGAVELEGVQYIHYMYWEVFHRDRADEFYSSFIRSFDGGMTWENCNDRIRFAHDSTFGIVTLAKDPDGQWCYMLGAQTGRGYRNTPGKLARFKYADILDVDKYEYWNGKRWVRGDEQKAAILIDGTIGEASLTYLEQYGKWLLTYIDKERGCLCYRSAKKVTGPWSQERTLVERGQFAGCYGSFVHPQCSTMHKGKIYWTMSQWFPYNVYLMESPIIEY